MEINTEKEIIALTNDIGVVTDRKVIIYKGKKSSTIELHTIKRINLFKKRKLFINLFLLLTTAFLTAIVFLIVQLTLVFKIGILTLLIALGTWSIYYKFYFYSIVIDLKDNQSLIFKTSQLRKEQTKNFYYSIRKKLRKFHLEK